MPPTSTLETNKTYPDELSEVSILKAQVLALEKEIIFLNEQKKEEHELELAADGWLYKNSSRSYCPDCYSKYGKLYSSFLKWHKSGSKGMECLNCNRYIEFTDTDTGPVGC